MQRLRAKCAGRVQGDDRVARGKTEAHRSMKPKSKEAKARFRRYDQCSTVFAWWRVESRTRRCGWPYKIIGRRLPSRFFGPAQTRIETTLRMRERYLHTILFPLLATVLRVVIACCKTSALRVHYMRPFVLLPSRHRLSSCVGACHVSSRTYGSDK